MPGSRIIWSVLSLMATGVLAICLFVGLSLFGRGTRAAVGTPMNAWTDLHRVEYYDSDPEDASRETVVLLASLSRSVSDFNELALALNRAGYRTLAIESHGVGGTDGGGPFERSTLHDLARDIDSVLQASAPHRGGQVHVIGHAFGNRVARTFAADHPDRVRSLALIAAGGRAPIPPEIEQARVVSSLSFLPDAVQEPALRRAFFAPASEIPRDWRRGWWFWGGMAQIVAAQATDGGEFWSGGGIAPMLVVQAEDDTIAPPQDAGLPLKFAYPDRVTLVGVPHAGHALLPEQPDAIAEAVLAFLAAHPVP
jgi:pimeloyl-ACP methyl ester carboxylesterase